MKLSSLTPNEVIDLARKQTETAVEYAKARMKAGRAKKELDTLLVAILSDLRASKANLGYDMAVLMLCERNEVARDIYGTLLEQTARYKGLDKIIEAIKTQILLYQSIWKADR